MKDKEKQIEEMAKEIMKPQDCKGYEDNRGCYFSNGKGCDKCKIERHENAQIMADHLYNAGYRKLPEDSVVISREEFDKLGLVVETVQEYESDEKGQPILVKERKIVKKLRTDFTELLNQEIRELQLTQVRKETAEKILNSMLDGEIGNKYACKVMGIEKYNELAKQFGVDIKE